MFMVLPVFAEEATYLIGSVKQDQVNVRAGANINFESICRLDKNDKVEIVSELYDWYRIRLPKDTLCYISANFIDSLPDSALARVNADKVNVRSGSDLNSSVLGQLSTGATVKVKLKTGDFFEIECPNNMYGWVSKSLIEVSNTQEPSPTKSK